MNQVYASSEQYMERIIYPENSSGIALIENMVTIFTIVEILCDKNELDFLEISENLKKHRETREFDFLLNGTLSYLGRIGDFYASEKSAQNGYTITELWHKSTGGCIHVVHTFDPSSKFRKQYLDMNSDEANPRYAIFQYSLNSDRTKLEKLTFSIPSKDGDIKKSIDLMHFVNRCRDNTEFFDKKEAKELLQKIKATASGQANSRITEVGEKKYV